MLQENRGCCLPASVSILRLMMLKLSAKRDRNKNTTRYKALQWFWKFSIATHANSSAL